MKPEVEQLIEKKAEKIAGSNYKKNHFPKDWDNIKLGFITGATEVISHPELYIDGVNKWVSLIDTLPVTRGEYLVYGNCTNDGIRIDIANWNGKSFDKFNQPTYWNFLPKPPQSII